jgi:colanic acid/amylovoran biosynthesis glycosyltransferase
MKVAIFVNSFPLITETFILNQIIGLRNRGIDLDIYSLKRSDPGVYHSVISEYRLMEQTTYLDEIPTGYLQRLRNVVGLATSKRSLTVYRSILRACSILHYGKKAMSLYLASVLFLLRNAPAYDIIHCQFGTIAPFVLQLIEIGALRGKLVTSFRGKDATVYLKRNPEIYRKLFKKGDLFLPVSESLRSELIYNSCDSRKIIVLYSGIDCKKFEFVKRTYNKTGIVRLVTVGRLVEKKGVQYIVNAVYNVLQTGRKVKLTIVGDGPLRSVIEALIAEKNMQKHICVTGWKTHDEVMSLLKRHHIMVNSSVTAEDGDREGIPNVLKEAMATGLPVIATDHGGISELVQNDVSGYIVPERDIDALTDRISFLIDHPDVWNEFGKAGRLHIENRFNIDLLNDRLVEYYTMLVRS